MSADQPQAPVSGDTMRTALAADRTLLAWVRTGIALMGFGFFIERFGIVLREFAMAQGLEMPPSHRFSAWLGLALVVVGIVALVGGALEHRAAIRDLGDLDRRGRSRLGPILAWSLAAIGVAMAIFLAVIA
ncbi:MAG: YidH family protein [Phycisphaerales bacterium]|jgi:putative membrane protein